MGNSWWAGEDIGGQREMQQEAHHRRQRVVWLDSWKALQVRPGDVELSATGRMGRQGMGTKGVILGRIGAGARGTGACQFKHNWRT